MMQPASASGGARMARLIRAPWLCRSVMAVGGALTLYYFDKVRG